MSRRASSIVVGAVSFVWTVLAAAAPHGAEHVRASVELPSKPTGPIALEHRLTAAPAIGVPLRIAVAAHVEGDFGRLDLEATATHPTAALVVTPTLVALDGGVYSWEIIVVPLVAEAGYLSVIVSGTIDGLAQARSVTIPLRSAGAAAPAAAPVVATRNGETLIALPVQESP
jgi:hypothetical protein